MKFRLFTRRLGVSAPKMTVRRHVPLPLRMASLALAVAVGAVGALWTWQAVFGNASAEKQQLFDELSQAKTDMARQKIELDRLTEIANKADSQIKMEKAASEQLAKQMKALESDNGKLLGDVAYLETLLPADGAAGNVAIRRLSVERDTSGLPQIRYKALVMQGGRDQKDFSGTLQIVATGTLNGKPLTITLPEQGSPEIKDRMKIAFKRYQRVEGFFDFPVGAVMKTVQLRLLEKSTLRAQETATL
jgi:hypothetical protein